MDTNKVLINFLCVTLISGFVIKEGNDKFKVSEEIKSDATPDLEINYNNPANVFNGVYTECFFQLSYTCIQKKTLLYLKELNRLNEISVVGDYVKFVKLNNSENLNDGEDLKIGQSSDELAYMIDKAVNRFFDNHLIKFSALGKDVLVPNRVEEFVGRKKRKGGGGGGHGGGDDGGKKKMMMMAMMCMKMKFMMMVPAMMGMMGMMSFKGMMFSMMSFMIAKMMLLMKILEKKGGGAGSGGGDGGWAAGGGGGGAWMPAGQDYGGGGGGYDANGQWQSRSIIEYAKDSKNEETPIISYAKPLIRNNNKINRAKSISLITNTNDKIATMHQDQPKSRKKRGLIDVLQNAYTYWTNKVLGVGIRRHNNYPKYKVFNGVKYVYHPVRNVKVKLPKELQPSAVKDEVKVAVDNFNKGEIVEAPFEGRMTRKKFHKMKENVKETVDDNPWE